MTINPGRKPGDLQKIPQVSEEGLACPAVLFFMTDFNSIDNMVPVAHKLAATGRGKPFLLLTSPFYNISDDYRLNFMDREHGIGTETVFTFHQKNPIIRWVMGLLCRPPRGGGQRSKTHSRVVSLLGRVFYRKAWAKQLLEKYQPSSLVFERSNATSGLVGALVMEGKRRGIPSHSVSHGLLSQTNLLVTQTEADSGTLTQRDYVNLFDHVVYETRYAAERGSKEGIDSDKIVVLGSPRYCNEWFSINLGIQPVEGFHPSGDASSRLKVVFMTTQWNYNVHRELTLEMISRLSKMDSVYLVIKAHPRWSAGDLGGILDQELPDNVEVVWDTPSTALIQWSDVVLNIASSIVLEILLQDKPLMQLRYLHSNTTICEEMGAGWLIDSEEELVAALQKLKDGYPIPYGEEQVGKVMSVVVDGDSWSGTDVLSRYVDLILDDVATESVQKQSA